MSVRPAVRCALVAFSLALSMRASTAASAQTTPQAARVAPPTVLDAFDGDTVSARWRAFPSDGVRLDIGSDAGRTGRAMRLAFDFQGRAGYAIARGAMALGTPGDNWSIRFASRGAMRPNTLEFKLVDRSGDNVWWYTIPEFVPSTDWRETVIRQRQVSFAWGPVGGGPPRDIASIEIVITAGQGGRGTLWVDDLIFTPMPPDVPARGILSAVATGSLPGSEARAAIDGDSGTVWRMRADTAPALVLDLGGVRTFGGVTIAWGPGRPPAEAIMDSSSDGTTWQVAGTLRGIRGARSYLPVPDGSARYLRLRFGDGVARPRAGDGTAGIREISVRPLAFAATNTALLQAAAADAPRGSFPRSFLNQGIYWAVVGVNGGRSEALLSEDGALELAKRGPSLEPFVSVGGSVLSWANVTQSHALVDRMRPIPSVIWQHDSISLTVTAFAAGTAANASTYARYRVTNRSRGTLRTTLWVALRPMQVNPPYQFLNTPGGAARVDSLRWQGGELLVNGTLRVAPLTTPTHVTLGAFDAGNVRDWIGDAATTSVANAVSQRVEDPRGLASALLGWPLTLAAGASEEIVLVAPLDGAGDPSRVRSGAPRAVASAVAARQAGVERSWAREQDAVSITLPSGAPPIGDAVKANLAWILINRDSVGIQPGSRSYERSWIRDGALTAEALLRLGRLHEARQFAEWYAPFQYPSGKVPCCVDARGPDPVDEHDSHGELIHLVYEVWRYSGDDAFARRMWPHVRGATRFIDSLRRTHRTAAYDTGTLLDYRGMLPASISHEGYSAKPMHSFWDDGFALLGLKEAASMATALGQREDAVRIASSRDEFSGDLHASLRRTMTRHRIGYLPGSVELGDFDATSTTTLLVPGGEQSRLPRAALDSTFARYYRAARARRGSDSVWNDYTPYEWRTVGALLRLGWKDEALTLLSQFMGDRRPADWQQWAEVVWRDPRTPRFIGDMPHTWVGSDFIRSALDLFAYERTDDEALVLAAGVPADWAQRDAGVRVRGLRTPWGPLGYALRATGRTVTLQLDAGLRIPPGGLVFQSPLAGAIASATGDGVALVPSADGTVRLRRAVRTLVVTHR